MKINELKYIIRQEILNEIYQFDRLVLDDEEYDGMFIYVFFKDNETNKKLNDTYIAYREKIYPNINNGDPVLELHIQVDSKYRRRGYSTEMIKTFLAHHGGVGYIPFGRIINPLMIDVLKKVDKDPSFSVEEYDNYYLIEEV